MIFSIKQFLLALEQHCRGLVCTVGLKSAMDTWDDLKSIEGGSRTSEETGFVSGGWRHLVG